mgnify:CR=1 FL=1
MIKVLPESRKHPYLRTSRFSIIYIFSIIFRIYFVPLWQWVNLEPFSHLLMEPLGLQEHLEHQMVWMESLLGEVHSHCPFWNSLDLQNWKIFQSAKHESVLHKTSFPLTFVNNLQYQSQVGDINNKCRNTLLMRIFKAIRHYRASGLLLLK